MPPALAVPELDGVGDTLPAGDALLLPPTTRIGVGVTLDVAEGLG